MGFIPNRMMVIQLNKPLDILVSRKGVETPEVATYFWLSDYSYIKWGFLGLCRIQDREFNTAIF